MIGVIVTAAILLLLIGAGLIFAARASAATATFPNFVIESSLDEMIFKAGVSSNFDPALLKGIARQESNLGQFRVGPSGELGLMQIHPVNFSRRPSATATDWRTDDSLSLSVATEILGDARRRFGSDHRLWLAAYNWGETKLADHLEDGGTFNTIPQVVQQYVSNVLGFARGFGLST